ncbi:NAD(+) synthase [Natroniella sulfidigena]|uniref:NAD(+) synthase n=1 Tax=Natroniella sulfidigena TaxID=723921 RepID=UPI00200B8A31|nr:NAD(+) synthase [Natroniella sulfidigena]MCK8816712.1 NAD(+) synthase [Natroniella sulfidigena]
MINRNYTKLEGQLVDWIRERVEEAGCQGTVVGLSGGIDSAVTAVLCQQAFPENNLGLILPCYSDPQDAEDAKKLAGEFEINYQVFDLAATFDQLLTTVEGEQEVTKDMAVANIKPRLRMTTLYYYASKRNSLVVGTDNRSELKIGYFTKHGDGGVDIAPLGNLVKLEVRELAKELGVPKEIISKPPSAGLWSGQTDEEELGISYEQLDNYILTGEAEAEVKEKVERLAVQNKHKLQAPPIPKF